MMRMLEQLGELEERVREGERLAQLAMANTQELQRRNAQLHLMAAQQKQPSDPAVANRACAA